MVCFPRTRWEMFRIMQPTGGEDFQQSAEGCTDDDAWDVSGDDDDDYDDEEGMFDFCTGRPQGKGNEQKLFNTNLAAHLETWSPLMHSDDIQLLTIDGPTSKDDTVVCSLRTVPLSYRPLYQALSYA